MNYGGLVPFKKEAVSPACRWIIIWGPLECAEITGNTLIILDSGSRKEEKQATKQRQGKVLFHFFVSLGWKPFASTASSFYRQRTTLNGGAWRCITGASFNIFSVNYIRKVFLQAAAAEETPIRDWIWGWKKLNQVRVQQRSLNLEDTFGMLAASSPLIWNTRVPLQLGQSFVVRWRGRLKRRTDRCKFRWKLNASLSNTIIQFKGKMEIYVSSKRFYS